MLKGYSPAKQKHKGNSLISVIWVANAILICSAMAIYPLLHSQIAALLAPLPTAIPSPISPTNPPSPTVPLPTQPSPTPVLVPTPTFPPTDPPPPTSTSSPTETASPIPFSQGPFSIGFSAGGRPLQMWRFGNGITNRLIVAGIHGGNELNTIQLADELIMHLQSHPEMVPSDVTLFVLRSLNPDGKERGSIPLGRANDNWVDLNRNWPYNWQLKWENAGCFQDAPVTGGAYAGSEPETVALMSFLQLHAIDALISYHSAALGIFPGGKPAYEPSIHLAEAIAAVTTYPYPAVNTGCEYTGNLTDWAAAQEIAAVDIELSDKKSTDFGQNLIVLQVFLNWKR